MSTLFKNAEARERMLGWYERIRTDIPVPTTTQRVATSFGETHVLSAGPEDAPPLVILHGAMATSALLLRELVHLTDRFRVHAVDVLGQSVMSADTRLPVKGDAHARWLGEVLDGLALPSTLLLGVSWGGFVAQRFAAYAPDRVARLALLVPAGLVNGSALEGVTKLAWPMARFRWSPTENNRDRFLGNLLTTTDDDWRDYLNDAFQSYRMNMEVPPLARPSDFAALAAPVFVMAAEHDHSFPGERLLARAAELFPTLAHAELLAGAKHSPPTTPAFRRELGAKLLTFLEPASQSSAA